VISDEDSELGPRTEALQRTPKDFRIWSADTLGVRNQDGIKDRRERQAFQLAALHANGSIRDQSKLEPRCSKG
jgi:hypothetical protein